MANHFSVCKTFSFITKEKEEKAAGKNAAGRELDIFRNNFSHEFSSLYLGVSAGLKIISEKSISHV